MKRLRLATYNVHGAVGLDGRRLPSRQLDILRRIAADCVALQEFVNDAVPGNGSLLDHWCESLGMHGRFAPAFTRGGQEFGNAVLSRYPFTRHTEHDISAPGGRRRIALEVVIDTGSVDLHVITVHCAVRARPRALQRPLIRALTRDQTCAVSVLLGDFNEWRASSALFSELREEFAGTPPFPTFPALAPVFPLDRIWVRPKASLETAHVEALPPASVASDHLPVVCNIAMPSG